MIALTNRWTELNDWTTRSLARCVRFEFRPEFNRTHYWTNYAQKIAYQPIHNEIGLAPHWNGQTERRPTDYERFTVAPGLQTFDPSWSPDFSAIQKSSGPKPHTMTAQGRYAPDTGSGLVLADFTTGRVRHAKATHYWVDGRVPFVTAPAVDVFYVVDYDHGERGYELKFESVKGALAHTVGDVTGSDCKNELGDAVCGLALSRAQDTITGATVFGSGNNRNNIILQFTSTPGTVALLLENWFAEGFMVGAGSTQNNYQIRRRIHKSSAPTLVTGTTYQITIQTYNAFPENMNPSELYDLTTGCDGRPSTCADKFSNLARFRGEPYQPGMRRIQKSGDAS